MSRREGKTQAGSQKLMATDAEIRGILQQRVDAMRRSVGIVVGAIDADGRRVVAYGHLDRGDARPLNGQTIFEIGSVTKVFTSLLLSEMVHRGKVTLNDPVAKFLPSDVKVPERRGKQITLVDLATHTSGLPRLPSNLTHRNIRNPYADYKVADLYQFLSTYTLKRDIGRKYEYSNLGGGLLGLALSLRAGMNYGELVQKLICGPLVMNSTGIQLTPEMKARLAVGQNAAMQAVPNWDFGPATEGAGALRSDADDMLTFVAANLGYAKTPLAPAMTAMLRVRRPTGQAGLEIALGWHVLAKYGREIVWHNGGTGGYRSFIGFDPQSRVGVVAFSNTSTWEGVDDIGKHLLDRIFPLVKNPRQGAIKLFLKLWARGLGF
ncbi:MAG: serine hydrolase domain-containing protein [Candidatus Acidiferrales bacterium]